MNNTAEDNTYRLEYICGPVSKKFHRDEESRVKLLIGPFGTGKTTSALYDIVMRQSRRLLVDKFGLKQTQYAIVRNTKDDLRDTTMSTLFEWFPPHVFGKYTQDKRKYIIKLENRIINLLFVPLDLEKDVRHLLSLPLTGAMVDEAREIREYIVQGLLGRIRRYPPASYYPREQIPDAWDWDEEAEKWMFNPYKIEVN